MAKETSSLPAKLRQANPLTEGRQQFSATEKNVYYIIIGRVRREYVERDMFDGKYDNLHVFVSDKALHLAADEDHMERARTALRNLRHKDIEVENTETEDWFNVGFINSAKYIPSKKGYDVEVSYLIMPYLVELSKNYTEYEITVVISLVSKWSQRMYELCSMYKNYNGGFFFKDIEQLRKMFALEKKYPNISLFEKYTIAVAYKELKEKYDEGQSDLWFDYTKEGRGKKTLFKFFVHTKDNDQKRAMAIKDTMDKARAVYVTLRQYFKRDLKYCDRVKSRLDKEPDIVSPVFEKVQRIINEYTKSDVPKIVRYALSNDYGIK